MTARSEAARRRERERKYVKKEAEAWAEYGWATMVNWREAQFIGGGGKLITRPRDFFGTKDQAGYDLMAIDRESGQVVGIQVTETPFVRDDPTHPGWADRNAAHGPPPFAIAPPLLTVDEFMRRRSALLNDTAGGMVQVITSYCNSRSPDRRWWSRE